MHRPLFLLTAGSVAACGALIFATALPAMAATSARADAAGTCTVPTGSPPGTLCTPPADTPVTFEVTTTGVLSITVPAGPVDLGTGAVGTTIGAAGNFGAVTVTDDRALDPASWTATVSSTDFVNSLSTADVIPAGDATYLTGAVIPDPVSGLPSSAVSVHGDVAIALSGTAQDVVTETGFDGDNAAEWTPEIDLAVPAGAVLGTYDATVTHSVS